MDVTSAKAAALDNKLNEWVHDYLLTEHEVQLDEYLHEQGFKMHGPELVAINKLQRSIGAEKDMLNNETADEMQVKINRRLKQLEGSGKSPIIAEEMDGHYLICDGSHLFEALKQMGREECWVIYWSDTHMHDEVAKRIGKQ